MPLVSIDQAWTTEPQVDPTTTALAKAVSTINRNSFSLKAPRSILGSLRRVAHLSSVVTSSDVSYESPSQSVLLYFELVSPLVCLRWT